MHVTARDMYSILHACRLGARTRIIGLIKLNALLWGLQAERCEHYSRRYFHLYFIPLLFFQKGLNLVQPCVTKDLNKECDTPFIPHTPL